MKKYSDILVANEEDIKGRIYNASHGSVDVDQTYTDVFIHIINKINKGSYNEENTFMPWVYLVTTNYVIDMMRVKSRSIKTITIHDESIHDFIINSKQAQENPERDLMTEERHQMVRDTLSQVRGDQRSVVERWIYDHKTMREIAEEDGTSLNTTLARNSYAKKKMKKIIEEYEDLY